VKIKIRIDDPETRAVWETAHRAKAEVESWPAWKRGDDRPRATSSDTAPSQDLPESPKNGE
jgi:hypothetical protein